MESETGQVPQQRNPSRRLAAWYVGGLLAVGVLLGAVRAWMLSRSEIIARDGMIYTAMAREWTSAPMQVIRGYDYAVGYPVAIVGMHGLLKALGLAERVDSWDLAGGLVSLVASMAALIAVWRWAVAAYDRWVALVVVLVAGLGRKWAGLGAEVLSDALAIAFQMWSLVLVHDAARRLLDRRRSAVLMAAAAGLCGGLGYLVRPESLLIPALGIVLILAMQLRRRLSWRLSVPSIAVMAGAAVVVSLPYMIAIGGVSKKKDLAGLLIEELAGSHGRGAVLASLGIGGLSWGGVSKYVAQVFEALHPMVGFVVLFLPAAILFRPVLPRLLREQAKGPSPIAGWLMLLYTVTMMVILLALQHATGYLSHRHVMMTALVLSPLAGQAAWLLGALVRWMVWHRRLRAIPQAVFVTLLTLLGTSFILGHNLSKPEHYGKGVYRQAGWDLARQTDSRAGVLADSPWIPYYMAQVDGRRKVVVKPDLGMPAGELRDLAARCRARYVVLPPQKRSSRASGEAALTAAGFGLWKQYVASDGQVLTVYALPEGEAGE